VTESQIKKQTETDKRTYIFAKFHGRNAVSEQTADLNIAFIDNHMMSCLKHIFYRLQTPHKATYRQTDI